MASPTSTVVPKASGFKTAVANIITSPLVLDKLQAQCYEESISGMITTAQFNNNFARGCLGREIIIQREGLGSSFKYCADGQALETNVPEEYTATSFKLRRSRYTRMMWSELDKLEHCGTNLGTMLASPMRPT